ncbi:MAG: DUF2695 domain-containing protein [Actinobacteria bacterium]|nr:DUF2695 domain-containing protein [Actinomycetota bacterium]
MESQQIYLDAEQIVRALSEELLAPRDGECLVCFVDRQLTEHGCDGTRRFALHFRGIRAPRATALERTLSEKGACCCDCEIYANAYERVRGTDAEPCRGVARGSAQPCTLWRRQQRGRW